MRKPVAAVGAAVFFALAPGVVAGLVPWWLTGWRMRPTSDAWAWLRYAGVVLVVAGGAVVVAAFVRFVTEGLGTPAPVAPPERLVVGGLYRYVRNPMYLAVLSCVVGQALLLNQPPLWRYAALGAVAMVAFVLFYEEPTLARRFGAEYDAYRRAVPGWLPRRRPWTPPSTRTPTP